MKIKIQKKLKSIRGLLVVPIFKEDFKSLPKNYPQAIKDFIKTLLKNKELKGKRGEKISTYKALIICFGEKKKLKKKHLRALGAEIGKHAKSTKSEEVNILILPELLENGQELLEGILMSQYKTKKKSKEKYVLKTLNLIADKKPKNLKEALKKAWIINKGIECVKDLVNAPSNIADSAYLEKEAKKIAKENRYKIAIFGNRELKKMKWGALLAVNQGSKKEPKCIILQYDGAKKKNEKPIIIIGKGIVFDTGGYNLKPTNFIETMHQDKAGGCVVLGLFNTLRKIGVKKNVIGIIPVAENLVSAEAYKPSDIIKSLSGQTIEITNTDAEGRLILADAITYGTKLKPEYIITIATLTGAVGVALGDRFAGLLANDITLRKKLQKAGSETDDLGWPLPMCRDYSKKMNSEVADMRNSDLGSSRKAGASKGAAFLERFVDKNKWCHIDIGGTAYTDDPKKYQTKGATGHGLQMLLRFLEKEA